MKVFVRSVFLLYVYLATVISTHHSSPHHRVNSQTKSHALSRNVKPHKTGPPLFLTPLIEAGKLEDARRLSKVKPFVDDIKSYSGFLTVNKTSKSHLFFWFIPKTTPDKTSAPVILWLQGGPGYSALFGLFVENGPFVVAKHETLLGRRSYSWTNNYHMLYVDQPVGTGFSFSETNAFINTQAEVAEHLYETLTQFYKLFPQFQTHDFYIAGESYGGKYAPALGHKIHTINREPSCGLDDFRIPLKGLMIGNGFADPENMLEYGALLQGMGLIDIYDRELLEKTQTEIKYQIRSGNWSLASTLRSQLLSEVSSAINLTNLLDYTDDDGLDEVSFAEFLRKNQTRRHIHVGNVDYVVNSQRVLSQFHDDIMRSARPWIEELLENDYPMLIYNGEFDIRDSHQLTENYLNKLRWSGSNDFVLGRKHVWRNDNKVAGYYKRAKNLIYVLVRGAGHMAPAYQPKNVLNLINIFINGELNNRNRD